MEFSRLPQVLCVHIVSYLNAADIVRTLLINRDMYDVSECTSELAVGRILQIHMHPRFLVDWKRDRSWRRLLYDLTKKRIILTGGKNQIELGPPLRENHHQLDLGTNTFLPLHNLAPPRQDFHLQWLTGNLYLISNSDTNDDGVDDIVRIEKYNYIKDEWKELQPLQCTLKCAATAVVDGKIWMIGGFNMELRERSADIHVLHCTDDCNSSWQLSELRLSKARSKHAAIVFNGELYVAGGYNGDFYFDSVEIFNPASRQWREGPTMTKVRRCFSLVAAQGQLLAVGGDVGRHNTIERLDIESNSWVLLTVVKDGRKFGCATAFGSKVFLFGGRDNQGRALDTWDAYDVVLDLWDSDISGHESRPLPREHMFNGVAIVVPSHDLHWT